jgi:hypothetical protein
MSKLFVTVLVLQHSDTLEVSGKDNTQTTGMDQSLMNQLAIRPSGNQASGAIRAALNNYIWTDQTNTKDTLIGIQNDTDNYGTGAITAMYGININSGNYADATVTTVIGGAFKAQSDGVSTDVIALQATGVASTATVTNMYGLKVADLTNTSSTVTSRYGLHIGSFTGSATNDYGIFQEGSSQKNYLAGNLGIGRLAPTQKLISLAMPRFLGP